MIVIRYIICQPNPEESLPIDFSNLDKLIETHSFKVDMIRTSIERLECYDELKTVNLGTLQLEMESFSEFEPASKILKRALAKRLTNKL